jgi:DNA mismatch repair protein MutS
MVVDETSRRNLELTRTMIDGRRKGTLLHLVDRCGSAMGSRLLREWFAFPLLEVEPITARHRAVAALVEEPQARDELCGALKLVADIERINARVAQGTAHARDLVALRRSLAAAPAASAIAERIEALRVHCPADLCADVHADLEQWLVDDPPISVTEGGLLRRGPNDELDELVDLSVHGAAVIAKLELRERERTGIPSLKVRRNKVFGYFIEVTRANVHRVPDDYQRKQTLTNAERYITPELKDLEERVLGADERRKRLEYSLFVALRERMLEHGARLTTLARSLASLDVLASLAEVAVRQDWVRPVVDDSFALDIVAGRHPVVETMLDEDRFVPNDVTLDVDSRQLIVLTGPNMAGKSTIMRQVALIVLLAQVGSFVPADRAQIGLCDRIFTRVGASDDLSRGQSTFMVEMSETSAILHHATRRSLVVLDEIGRGTSTYDGLAIAWSVAEDLVDRVGCRALFATHYHELCELASTRPEVVNQSIAVSEWGDRILFLRKLKEGGASRSYGIQCARLAGLPDAVIQRATQLLTRFEKHAPRNERRQLSLFVGASMGTLTEEVEEAAPATDELREALAAINPDELSPRAAHAALYELLSLL